jgi:hypothetical protein
VICPVLVFVTACRSGGLDKLKDVSICGGKTAARRRVLNDVSTVLSIAIMDAHSKSSKTAKVKYVDFLQMNNAIEYIFPQHIRQLFVN